MLIFPIFVLSQPLPEPECSQSFTRFIKNATFGNYAANDHCTYADGTKSASSLTCFEINCCERYLTGTHTKGKIQYKSWRYINQLNCTDSNGKSKTYINGKDADIPTNIKIDAEEVNIAKTEGDYSPAFAGDNNSFEQITDIDSERKWHEKPLGIIFIGVIIGLIILLIKYFITRKSSGENRISS